MVIATINHSVFLLKRIYDRYPNILPAYYVQDYEPFFFEKGSEDWKIAYDSYTYYSRSSDNGKNRLAMRNSHKLHNIDVEKVSPSIDTFGLLSQYEQIRKK